MERSILTSRRQYDLRFGNFDCSHDKITSLEGAPKIIQKDFRCVNNKLKSLHNIHKIINYIGGTAYLNINPIRSHVLGLLLIDGLGSVHLDADNVTDIINKHLRYGRDIFACQEELIENGFEVFAQL